VSLEEVPVRFAGTILLPSDDVQQFLWLPDFDRSGGVDISDLLELLASWGECAALPATCHASLNGDSAVDVNDLLKLLDAWSNSP